MASAATLLRVWRMSIVAKNTLLSIGRPCFYFVLAQTDYIESLLVETSPMVALLS